MRKLFKKLLEILDGTPAQYGRQRQRGQSTVELAFALPVLLIMVAGIIEIGWFANNYINLLEAAKVGARRGPFLNSENSPQVFPSEAIIHPQIASSGYGVLPRPEDVGFDPTDPRNRARNIYFPPRTRCDRMATEDFGFYNIIICTVLDSMDPLEIRIAEDLEECPPDMLDCEDFYDSARYQDDIVVSAFSILKFNNGPPGQLNDQTDIPFDYDLPVPPYREGHQIIVVGRWPQNANECWDAGMTGPGVDARDPFDYIENGVLDTLTFPTGPDTTITIPIEMATTIINPDGSQIYEGYHDPKSGDSGFTSETQRGFMWTGQHTISDVEGTPCYGSEFSLQEVESSMNLERFIESTGPSYQDRLRYLPSTGVVLVEVFWEHDLLMGEAFPIFFAAYNVFNNLNEHDDQNVIHVWAAFPAVSAEPSIVFELED